MKHGKSIRMLCIVLALAMTLSVCGVVAFADETTMELWSVLKSNGKDFFTQTGDASAHVYKETKGDEENKFIRITAGETGKTWGSFGINTAALATAGTYRIEFDARIPDDYSSNNFFIAAYTPGVSKTLAGSKSAMESIMSGEANEWGFKHVTAELQIPSDGVSVLKFGLNCTGGNYIDIDNVAVYKRISDVTLGTENLAGANCDFEEFVEKGGSRTLTSNWDNSFLAGGDANTASLVYLTESSAGVRLNRDTAGFASFIKDSVNNYAAGDYTARVTVIADEGFATDNIGFRINKNGGQIANNIALTGTITADGCTESVLTGTYTLAEAYNAWTHFNMWCNILNAGKGITITKIEILNSDNTNIDTLGDLGKITVSATETLTGLVGGAWAHGYYLPTSNVATTTIVRDGDDVVLKFAPAGDGVVFTSVTKSVDAANFTAGKTYAIQLKVKAVPLLTQAISASDCGQAMSAVSRAVSITRRFPKRKAWLRDL